MPINQLRIYTISELQRQAFFERWDSMARPLMERFGFHFVDTWTGRVDPVQVTPATRITRILSVARRPWVYRASRDTFEFVYRLEWADEQQMKDAWVAFLAEPMWIAAKATSRKSKDGEPVLFVSDRVLTAHP